MQDEMQQKGLSFVLLTASTWRAWISAAEVWATSRSRAERVGERVGRSLFRGLFSSTRLGISSSLSSDDTSTAVPPPFCAGDCQSRRGRVDRFACPCHIRHCSGCLCHIQLAHAPSPRPSKITHPVHLPFQSSHRSQCSSPRSSSPRVYTSQAPVVHKTVVHKPVVHEDTKLSQVQYRLTTVRGFQQLIIS